MSDAEFASVFGSASRSAATRCAPRRGPLNGFAILSRTARRRARAPAGRAADSPLPRRASWRRPAAGLRGRGRSTCRTAGRPTIRTTHYKLALARRAAASPWAPPTRLADGACPAISTSPRPTRTCSTRRRSRLHPRTRARARGAGRADWWPRGRRRPDALAGRALFTYWDYRAGMFHQDLGMRIDLVLAHRGRRPSACARPGWTGRRARARRRAITRRSSSIWTRRRDGDIGPVVPPPSAPRARGPRRCRHVDVRRQAGEGIQLPLARRVRWRSGPSRASTWRRAAATSCAPASRRTRPRRRPTISARSR